MSPGENAGWIFCIRCRWTAESRPEEVDLLSCAIVIVWNHWISQKLSQNWEQSYTCLCVCTNMWFCFHGNLRLPAGVQVRAFSLALRLVEGILTLRLIGRLDEGVCFIFSSSVSRHTRHKLYTTHFTSCYHLQVSLSELLCSSLKTRQCFVSQGFFVSLPSLGEAMKTHSGTIISWDNICRAEPLRVEPTVWGGKEPRKKLCMWFLITNEGMKKCRWRTGKKKTRESEVTLKPHL